MFECVCCYWSTQLKPLHHFVSFPDRFASFLDGKSYTWFAPCPQRQLSQEKKVKKRKKTTSAKKCNAVLQTAFQPLVSCGIVNKGLLNGSPVARSRLENNFSPKWSPFSFLLLKLLIWKRWPFHCVYPDRYEQVCSRIKIHNCWASRTLQRRMSENIWFTKQVSDKLERL